MTLNRSVTLLLVEDDIGHARLIEKNLKRAHVTNNIVTVDNGQKAVDFLFSEGKYKGVEPPHPLLVLLDLNLPVLDGYQVLKRMKEDEKTHCIPVIILSTTDDPAEIHRCYELGCNVYINKPVEYDQFSENIRSLGSFLQAINVS